MLELLDRHSELSQVIDRFLRCFRIFLGPLNVENKTRKRIEGGIGKHLLEQKGLVGEFHDRENVYRFKIAEEPIRIFIESDAPILGLVNELIVSPYI